MKLFLTTFRLKLKEQLSSLRIWIFAILLPLSLIGAFLLIEKLPSPLQVKVGIAFEEEDPFSQEMFRRLQNNESMYFLPLYGYSQEELETLLLQEHYESIYILPPNLGEKIGEGNLVEIIPALYSRSSTINSLCDKWVFSAALSTASKDICIYALSKQLGEPKEKFASYVEQRYQWFDENYQFVSTMTTWEGGIPPQPENSHIAGTRISRGLISLFLLIVASVGIEFLMEGQRHVAPSLIMKQRSLFFLGSFSALWSVLILLGGIGLLVLQLLTPWKRPLLLDSAGLLFYSFFLTGVASLISQLVQSTEGLFSGTLFVLLTLFVFGGVFFDPQEVSSWLVKASHLFPTSYYIDSVILQSYLPLLALAGAGLLLFLLNFFLSLRPKRS